jgi:hypothetical protein
MIFKIIKLFSLFEDMALCKKWRSQLKKEAVKGRGVTERDEDT